MMKGLEVIIWDGSDFIPVSTVSLARQHDTSLVLTKPVSSGTAHMPKSKSHSELRKGFFTLQTNLPVLNNYCAR